jgi:hypothetical protein
MSNDVNSVFDAFVQAKEALQKVPELEATIAQQADALKTDEELMSLYRAEVETLKNERDLADAQRRATEDALEKARKSNGDLETRLDLVLGTFRSLSSDIAATLSVVTPEPEPLPLPEPLPEPLPTVPTSTDAETNGNAPRDSIEASYKAASKGWYDTNNDWHNGTGVSVPLDPTTSTSTPSTVTADSPVIAAATPSVTAVAASAFTKEVTPTTSVPFAQSTASPSATAEPTTSAPPPAPSSDTASNEADTKLPDWLYRPVGEPRYPV